MVTVCSIHYFIGIGTCVKEVETQRLKVAVIGSGNIGTDLMMKIAGTQNFHSSFFRHAERAVDDCAMDARAFPVELGRRRMVGGQEDMITDVALDLRHQSVK